MIDWITELLFSAIILKRTVYLFFLFLFFIFIGRFFFVHFFERALISLGEQIILVKDKYQNEKKKHALVLAYHQLKKKFHEHVLLLQNINEAEKHSVLQKKYNRKTIQAEIFCSILNAHKKVIFINKGARDNLVVGMVIVSGMTLIGKIIRLFDSYAEVLLLDDEKQSVSVFCDSSGIQGIAKGSRLSVDRSMHLVHWYDDSTKEPQKGELVFSSGKGFVYPAGYVVGTVDEIEIIDYGEKIIRIKNDYDLEYLQTCEVIIDDKERRAIEKEIYQEKE